MCSLHLINLKKDDNLLLLRREMPPNQLDMGYELTAFKIDMHKALCGRITYKYGTYAAGFEAGCRDFRYKHSPSSRGCWHC